MSGFPILRVCLLRSSSARVLADRDTHYLCLLVRTDGTVTLDSTDLELMHDGWGLQVVAIRFPSVDLAPGTTIGTASILFDVDEVRPGQSDQKVSITIFGEASANPAPLTAGSFDLSNRGTTSAAEMWTPTASTTTHEDLATSDISSILNEIVR
eukprot:COSAG02_NODE_32489_length_515_cov_1.040865_1_plen_153_part_01